MSNKYKTKKAYVEEYKTLLPYFLKMSEEYKILSKKKPDATINKTKVKMINTLLERIKVFLSEEKGSEFLYLVDDDALPQYSDVVIILSQYNAALREFEKHYYSYVGDRWSTEE